jgi:RND family efflux transporter MFP subunit
VAEVEARVRRTRALAEQELVSAQDLETQEAQLAALEAGAAAAAAAVEQAQATAQERRSALAKTVVRSPVSGRLGERRAEVGMLVDPSTLLFVAGSLDRLIVEVPLTAEMLSQLDEGQPVILRSQEADAEPIRATLSRISPFLAAESFTTVGEIDVDNRQGSLRPGMYVDARILYGETQQATLVPASAVWEDPQTGERGLFVVEEAAGLTAPEAGVGPISDQLRAVSFRPAQVLAEGRGTTGVEGVADGEWVVIVGQHLLRERQRDAMSAGQDGAVESGEPPPARARVRTTSWARVRELQQLQNEDLLAGFLDKQQRIAAALGAEIPASEDEVDRVLGRGDSTPPDTADGGGS